MEFPIRFVLGAGKEKEIAASPTKSAIVFDSKDAVILSLSVALVFMALAVIFLAFCASQGKG